MIKTELVFLMGLQHSGKDTVGKVFVDNGYTRVAFADTVKEEYAKLNNVSVEDLHIQGPIKESHRQGIINYAEAKRKEDPMYWVKKAIQPFLDEKNNIKEGLRLVFTDVRRISELDWVYELKEMNVWGIDTLGLTHYVVPKLFIIERKDNVDNDNLTHEAIGYAKGIHKVSNEIHFIDSTITNNGTETELITKRFHNRVTI